MSYPGSCLCGAVRFEVDQFDQRVAHCHCSMCRRFHGTGFATIAGVSRRYFRFVEGETELNHYTAENETVRSFCKHCGASLFFATPRGDPDSVEIALGAFTCDIPVEPDAHIFVGSGANWTLRADGLPQFEAGRDSRRVDL